jgi:CRISPR-associated endonuclease/helicase Cas3
VERPQEVDLGTQNGTKPLAHSQNAEGKGHDLAVHLASTSSLAMSLAAKFSFRNGANPVCAERLAGPLALFHDAAKAYPPFGRYLDEMALGRPSARVPHAAASGRAAWRWVIDAIERVRPGMGDHDASRLAECSMPLYELLLPVIGHHAGLGEASGCVQAAMAADPAAAAAGFTFLRESGLFPSKLPSVPLLSGTQRDMFIRMVSSTMFDADRLDTEAHFRPRARVERQRWAVIAAVASRFEAEQQQFMEDMQARVARGEMSAVVVAPRDELHSDALVAAENGPGIYRLQAPTGCGKTRALMAFSARQVLLAQAGRFGAEKRFDRIIIALPFTSIIDQVADILRAILENRAASQLSVLEHHGAADAAGQEEGEGQSRRAWTLRMAEENWDAPVVVTTFVQLFESLLSNKPQKMRKLHNIARSVIVLDEVQALPTELLDPTMDVVRSLVEDCGCTVLFSTATQPFFENAVPALRGCTIRAITRRPDHLFSILRRVRYEMCGSLEEPISVADLAAMVTDREQALVVLNTRRDAIRIVAALPCSEALAHLSTLLCPAHRRQVLDRVRLRLLAKLPIRLVSTQVIEAGVDLDFPWGARAFGPLWGIAQVAGRVNREGMLRDAGGPALGTMVVFCLENGGIPPDLYQEATNLLYRMLPSVPRMLGPGCEDLGPDFGDKSLISRYYDTLMAKGVDAFGIQAMRRKLDFPGVAAKYRMIREEQTAFCVDWQGNGHSSLDRFTTKPSRDGRRALQQYLVQLRGSEQEGEAAKAIKAGCAERTDSGIWRWVGEYDDLLGLRVPT